MKNYVITLCLSLCLLLSGCSKSVQLKIMRAPEIELPKSHSLKIEPFIMSENLAVKEYDDGTALSFILDIVTYDSDEIVRKNSHFQRLHTIGLGKVVAADSHLIVDWGNTEDFTLGGTLFYSVKDSLSKVKRKDSQGKPYQAIILKRNAEVTVELRVTDKNKNLLGTSSFSLSKQAEAEARSEQKVFRDIIQWEILVEELIEESYVPTLHTIAPHSVIEKRVFAKGPSKLFKEANKAAEKNDWQKALNLWKEAEKSGECKDKGASMYNQAIFAETKDSLEEALRLYEEAYELTRKSSWKDAIKRTRSRIEEAQRLRKITNQ